MTSAAVSKEDVLDRLAKVFRDQGYEAASLSRLAKASGLGKASLYYHFPNGKQEMALAVIERAEMLFSEQILQPLRSGDAPAQRIAQFLRNLDTYYCNGEESCLLGVFAMTAVPEEFEQYIVSGLKRWIDELSAVLEEAGLLRKMALGRAETAVCWIEGALLVSRGTKSTKPFKQMLSQLKAFLLHDL
ncbi:TetR/AcrR family transcriptional regulator [Alcaligenaceae bacterium]|nr:TetR/AcrR family transcriptional regulator [Alcaligenaceae bacterium]